MKNMKIDFLPKTRLGTWSVWLIVLFLLFFKIFQFFVISGQRGGETFFSNLTLAVPILLAGISGIASFFVGTAAIIKRKERSVFVFLSTVMGLFILLFCLGEVIFPH
jgi:hypothetical protein